MIHSKAHPLNGKTVTLTSGDEFRLEDWWDRVAGKPWGACDSNPACLNYATRSVHAGLPLDDEVVYGKIGAFGHLIHVSELRS